MAVLPLDDSATEVPSWAAPLSPAPVIFCCCVQVLPLRVKTHAAPAFEMSPGPPKMAVLPSPESATEDPCSGFPLLLLPISICWSVQVLPLRVKTHAAPIPP